jgi:hypothetical protein
MWRVIRIALLLVILASVAQTAWLARTRTAEWKTPLRVAIYPIAADASDASRRYVAGLGKETFEDIEAFFKAEAAKHSLPLPSPVELILAPPIASPPPPAPFGGNALRVILWSLELRYWAWWNDTVKGPKPHVRVFVTYHDPALDARLPHSTGLQKGLLGVVNAYAQTDMDGSNNVVIAHELLHTLGATDKYDPATNLPVFPDGYADPQAQPLHPQRRAEIMAGRIPVSETRAATPTALKHAGVGEKTAREIGWVR